MNTKPDKGVPVMKRKRGFSLTEILIVLAVSSIVLAIVAVVSSMTFKTSSQLNATMTLDEEITKLHTNMRYIISQSWTALKYIGVEDDIEGQNYYIEMNLSNPFRLDEEEELPTIRIEYLPDERKVVHYYQADKAGNMASQTIANHVDEFSFSPIEGENYVTYEATFTYYSDVERTKPITSKRTSGAVRFY